MNDHAPFTVSDLDELGDFLRRAERIVPMYDVARGDTGAGVIGLRHDVDDNAGSLGTALRLGEWEFEQGFSSTFYLLHGSYYWGPEMLEVAAELENRGHEIGLHVNAVAEALRTGRDPAAIIANALAFLREAVHVRGCVAHGDALCRNRLGDVVFVNDEIFAETPRSSIGIATRTLRYRNVAVQLGQVSRASFGLEYDAAWLDRGDYLSDSGGEWSKPFADVVDAWPARGQLHILVHPDWWSAAFPLEVAA